jgi:DNA-binding transcriptional LysR family regulator
LHKENECYLFHPSPFVIFSIVQIEKPMNRDIDIALLRTFVTVIETGGVTNASRMLSRTQAAVSQQIKRLEDLFGEPLFSREHKRLSLSPAGERLLGPAQRLIAMNDETWSHMTTPDFEGDVRLGVPHDIVANLIPSVLQKFNKARPKVRVVLICKGSKLLLEDLAANRVDLTLTTEINCGTYGETLMRDRLVWVGGRGMQTWREIPLPVSLGSKHCKFRPEVLRALQAAGRVWRVVSDADSMEATYSTLKAGLAVSAMLRSSVPDYLDVLGAPCNLPGLPDYMVNLYQSPTGRSDIATELARHIRQDFAIRFGPDRLDAPGGRPAFAKPLSRDAA